ncbi:MAG: NAD(+)--rifampin ADP-ribosyltransferase [Ignavibacteria bacterium]|nr:NAD(+)--rifampin ADP-ribosyltransferase [Ignavibacteria bacterium]
MSGTVMDSTSDGIEYYHGTKAELNVGDPIEPGFRSNYGSRRQRTLRLSHGYARCCCKVLNSLKGRGWQDLRRGTNRFY